MSFVCLTKRKSWDWPNDQIPKRANDHNGYLLVSDNTRSVCLLVLDGRLIKCRTKMTSTSVILIEFGTCGSTSNIVNRWGHGGE